jgi:hypothetical protein
MGRQGGARPRPSPRALLDLPRRAAKADGRTRFGGPCHEAKQQRTGFGHPRPWAFEEAQGAVPYFSSLARSLREHYLAILAKWRDVQLLKQPRPFSEAT